MSGGMSESVLAVGGEEFEMVVEMGSCGVDYSGDWFGWCVFGGGCLVYGGVAACLWNGTVVVAFTVVHWRFLVDSIIPMSRGRRLRRKI